MNPSWVALFGGVLETWGSEVLRDVDHYVSRSLEDTFLATSWLTFCFLIHHDVNWRSSNPFPSWWPEPSNILRKVSPPFRCFCQAGCWQNLTNNLTSIYCTQKYFHLFVLSHTHVVSTIWFIYLCLSHICTKKWEENVSLACIYNDPFQSNKFLGPLPSHVSAYGGYMTNTSWGRNFIP